MSDVLVTAWRTVALGWHLGRTLFYALARGGIGLLVGLVVFGVGSQLAPPEYRHAVWNGGIILTGLGFAVLAFLNRLQRAPVTSVNVVEFAV